MEWILSHLFLQKISAIATFISSSVRLGSFELNFSPSSAFFSSLNMQILKRLLEWVEKFQVMNFPVVILESLILELITLLHSYSA